MRAARPDPASRFGLLTGVKRVWAVAAIHGELRRLEAVHDEIERRLQPRDAIVYLGNMVGRGPAVFDTIAELLSFRRAFIARNATFASDLVYLRGSQEEMWRKLLELQYAPNPGEVFAWMLDHGLAPVIAAYGFDPAEGFAAIREGTLAVTRWTNAIRAAVNAAPGHAALLSALRRAAYTTGNELLFVHAGVDLSRPLTHQRDSFWWGGPGFLDAVAPYEGFLRIVRGFDRQHQGLRETDYALSIDHGCGFGGPLACVCLGLDGAIQDSFGA